MAKNEAPTRIDEFRGKYYFLSNFYACYVLYEGETWKTTEHAFQAMKTIDLKEREEIRKAPSPGVAKRLGRKVKMREDWEKIKDDVMYQIVLQKFKQNKDLRNALVQTGDALLIEGNSWGDFYWGMCRGEGQNKLGHILMQVRKEMRDAR